MEKPASAVGGFIGLPDGCMVEDMQDDTVMNKCKNMFNSNSNSTGKARDAALKSHQKKATGRFNMQVPGPI